jgi:uncharacterized protein (TIGR02421 family)
MLDAETRRADRTLSALARRVDALLDVTPVNGEEAWQAWIAAGCRGEPALTYRDVVTDVDGVRAELRRLDLDGVGDPTLHRLLADKADELGRLVDLVAARNTPAFLDRSLDLYGTAEDTLLALAETILADVPPPRPPDRLVTPEAFAARAAEEVARYRRQRPGLVGEVSVRHDVPSLMVHQRDVLVGTDAWVPSHRVEALVHHEVGTHLLTAVTGGDQPLTLLEQGLARFEETQEALGVLAEHLVDGLDAERLRTLAARVVAVRRRSDGGDFDDLVGSLRERGVEDRAAWTIAVRVARGGGFTKDVVYLRGIVDLVAHLAGGGALEPLLVGKLHLHDAPAVEALLADGILVAPSLRPAWLDGEAAQARLAAVLAGEAPVNSWV